MKKLIILVCSCLCLMCAPAFGHDAAKDAKIEKLLVAMNIDKQMDTMFGQMKAMFASQQPAGMTPEQKAKFDEMQGKILDLVRSKMSWEKMKPAYIQIYADTYTDQEIDGISAFYDSPAGKAMLAKTPELMQKSMALAQGLMKDLMPEVEKLTKESMKAAGTTK